MRTLFTLLHGTVQKRLAHQSREGETCDIGVKWMVKIFRTCQDLCFVTVQVF